MLEGAEVTAHRRLRQLEHRPEFGDGELVPLQHQEDPGADGVGKGREAVVEGGAFHPYIRMKGYKGAATPVNGGRGSDREARG